MTTVGFLVKLNYICGINEEANICYQLFVSASSIFIIIDNEGKMLVVAIFILTTNLKSPTAMRKTVTTITVILINDKN